MRQSIEAGRRLFTEGRGGGQFVKGGGRLLIKGGGKMFVKAGEPISQGKVKPVVKGGRIAIHQERKDASLSSREGRQGHLSREGGCQCERGRMSAIH